MGTLANVPSISTAGTHGKSRPKVAVVGIGSIGGIVAGSLQLSTRCDLVACARRPLSNLLLELPTGPVDVQLRTLTEPGRARRVDWVLLCTEAYETPLIAPWIPHLCMSSTRVAVLQNGIDHVGRLSPLIAGVNVVPIIVYFNAQRLSSNRVRLRQANEYDLVAPDDSNGIAFAELFNETGLQTTLKADFINLLWRKLLLNSVANRITTLTRQRLTVLRRPQVRTPLRLEPPCK